MKAEVRKMRREALKDFKFEREVTVHIVTTDKKNPLPELVVGMP